MILVTGGTGLLGSHLLYELVKRGSKVRATKRKNSNTAMVEKIFSYYTSDPHELFRSVEWVDADILDYSSMEDAIQDIDEVYHCAAIVSFDPRDESRMMKVNVESTANLVNLALQYEIRKFCHVSSVSTLGRADHDGYTDEDTWWRTNKKNTRYAISKYNSEREVWRAMEEGLSAVIVNPSVILGPGFWDGNSGLFRIVNQGMPFYTEGVNGYIDARDTARAMVLLMDRELFNHRFVLNSANLSYREFFTLIAKYLDKPAPSIHIRPYMTGIAWRLEYLRSLLYSRRLEITAEMANHASQKYFYSSDKFRRMTGFEFTPIEKTIREIAEIYLRETGVAKQQHVSAK